MTKHAPEPRVPLNLRIGAGGKRALTDIAARLTRLVGYKVTTSDVSRDALALFCMHHESLARIAAHRSISTGRLVFPIDVAHAAMRDYAATHDPERQRR